MQAENEIVNTGTSMLAGTIIMICFSILVVVAGAIEKIPVITGFGVVLVTIFIVAAVINRRNTSADSK